MTGFDYAVIGIIVVSLLLGLWRGFIYEVLSLAGWPLALVLSKLFAAEVEPLLPISQEQVRVLLAYALVFVVSLIVWGMLVWLISRLVKAAGLGGMDLVLGGLFGLLRGALLILAGVCVAGLTSLPEQSFWREAKYSGVAEELALMTRVLLPDNIAQRMHYRNRR